MRQINSPVPHLATAQSGPLYHVEALLLKQVAKIEAWFRQRWQEYHAPITSSVDLRHAGFKLAPVDTNLFPAGFNNLSKELIPLSVQAIQSVLQDRFPECMNVLIIPESHTRNHFYQESLLTLKDIFHKAGFMTRMGSLDEQITAPYSIDLEQRGVLTIYPLVKHNQRLSADGFTPCVILLNNDLSTGIPQQLQHIEQPILPSIHMGWQSRLKSKHFKYYQEITQSFAAFVGMDPWLITPLFSAVEGVDFMAQQGLDDLAKTIDDLLAKIRCKYAEYHIKEAPFVAVKADNGTYGMSVMMVRDGQEILHLNRKQRTKMSASKGSQKVSKIIVQEGVYSFETMRDGAVAEPVVYMIGPYVVGGFYRVHRGRGKTDNLNAPGMHFEPLAFAKPCNTPCEDLAAVDSSNRFYAYGVIARLAALAAAMEIANAGEKK